MDRKLEKKGWSPARLALIIGGISLVLVLASLILKQSGKSSLRIDSSRITVSRVEQGQFLEYYPSSGWVEPEISYFLDVEQGGRAEEILVEGGQYVNKGDLILRLSNVALQRQNIETEMRLMENLDRQQNTQFARTSNKLMMRESLQDLEYQILDLEKRHRRYKALTEQKTNDLSREQFEAVRDELAYRKNRRDLLKERIRIEDQLSEQQLELANKSIERINVSLDLLNQIAASMDVRAPISGHLSSISAEIGQNILPGQRIGQIDLLDKFKLRVEIDQYYLNRVEIGTKGKFELDGRTFGVAVKKIYPEVLNNIFNVDMTFIEEPPPGLKRGQELTVELSFGEPSQSLMVSKGGFYQQTSGRWVYLITAEGKSAVRTDIRLGRQNPRHVEVLEGLHEGDWVITSGYDSFNAVDELIFNEGLDLER
ncbi:MAG: HlyD family efflux transporter periplasmic adaptor subunit [Gammaproteobacteria bacterium]|nr:MAG: HlyD family efflux transporter periplasmic adaptor subunit [Gammaproteobacteria bacterium]